MYQFFSSYPNWRRLFFLSCIFLSGQIASAQAPNWQAVAAINQISSGSALSNSSQVNATAADATGNIYLAGSFSGTISFGATTLTSAGTSGGLNLFVAKWNSASKQFVWAQRAGGTSYDVASAIVVSGSTVYVAGTITGSATFGSLTVTSAGSTDVFIAKLADLGTTSSFIWAQRAGGANNDAATALAVAGTSVYVTGRFNSATASFGSTTLTNTTRSYDDIFVAKLTDTGATSSFGWVQQLSGTDNDNTAAIVANGPNVYLSGYFASTTLQLGTLSLTNSNAGKNDVFVAKLVDMGTASNFVWAQQAGSTENEAATGLAVNGSNIYVSGYFYSASLSFGPASLTNAAANLTDIFVAKLTDKGNNASFI